MMPLFAKTEYDRYAAYVVACSIGRESVGTELFGVYADYSIGREPVGTELFGVYADYPGGGVGVCPHCGNTLLIEALNCRQIVCSTRQVNPHPAATELAAWRAADPAGTFGCYAELRM
jgi:hypothetical protein